MADLQKTDVSRLSAEKVESLELIDWANLMTVLLLVL